jgi:hypothetical protein
MVRSILANAEHANWQGCPSPTLIEAGQPHPSKTSTRKMVSYQYTSPGLRSNTYFDVVAAYNMYPPARAPRKNIDNTKNMNESTPSGADWHERN